MKKLMAFAVLACGTSFLMNEADAQATPSATPLAASAPTLVPALVPFVGVAIGTDGKAVAGEASATFLLFREEHGGEPSWIESQTIVADAMGRYQVKLGASSANGVPVEMFAGGDVRWLEVQIAGQSIGPRTLLTSVPYAMKAADAATLGGLPASAFMLASGAAGVIPATPSGPINPHGITSDAAASNVTTTGGTNLYVPRFSGAATIVNSEIYDTGTSVGIGTIPNPGAKLDVNGSMIMRGNMTVSRTGNATASTGYPSYGFDFFSNVYNSSSKASDNPYFQLQSEPTGNNTTSPSATFNLLFANNGSKPAETGLFINPDGTINFAANQTLFASSSSTTAAAVTGYGVVMGVNGSSVNGTGVFGSSSNGTGIYGSTSIAGYVYGPTAGVMGQSLNEGNGSGLGGNVVAGVWGDSDSNVGVQGTSSQSVGVNGISYSAAGVAGSSTTGSGIVGTIGGIYLNTAAVFGKIGASAGFNGIAGVWGDATAHVGVLGTSNQYPGVQGQSTSGSGVTGESATSYGGSFSNTSNIEHASPALLAMNYGDEPTTDGAIFRTFEASTADGSCGFGGAGNMTCTGQVKTLAATGNGGRMVETYSMQSPENWMEDFGSGMLRNGVATISLEAAFAETVSGKADYHVFLTPNGDSKGLYVFRKTATSFEVRESGGGTSTIGFDYRIVAKRKGFEGQRMVDVTDEMKAVNARKAESFAKAAKTYKTAK